jgi:hypothetical protein
MLWLLLLPPIVLWGLLFWQDLKLSATRSDVVDTVKDHLVDGWLIERGDILMLANSAARRHRLILPPSSVDEILEEVGAALFADFSHNRDDELGRRRAAVEREPEQRMLQNRVRILRRRMHETPAVRPAASTAFAIGAVIVLGLWGLFVYLPQSMQQPSPLGSLSSFWDQLIGVVATNVVGLVAAWFASSRPSTRVSQAIDEPADRGAWPFGDRV